MFDYVIIITLKWVPFLFAVILHEVAHGWVAEKLGDPTARVMGRITLNPLVHIDLVGSILLPAFLYLTDSPFLFGWAKPVPVNFANLRGGRKDMAMVALSGPLTNFVLAALSSLVYHMTFQTGHQGTMEVSRIWHDYLSEPLHIMAFNAFAFNLVLMVINLLPIPPLDGGRIVVGLAPLNVAVALERMEHYGMLIVLILIGTGLWSYIVRPVLTFFWHILM
ncbi:MAG: site-2 protease family protein [Desulfobacteraceae bacterium]|nr:site-2 protease family protein [Desulfobacteraceae bacterium]